MIDKINGYKKKFLKSNIVKKPICRILLRLLCLLTVACPCGTIFVPSIIYAIRWHHWPCFFISFISGICLFLISCLGGIIVYQNSEQELDFISKNDLRTIFGCDEAILPLFNKQS